MTTFPVRGVLVVYASISPTDNCCSTLPALSITSNRAESAWTTQRSIIGSPLLTVALFTWNTSIIGALGVRVGIGVSDAANVGEGEGVNVSVAVAVARGVWVAVTVDVAVCVAV